MKLISLNVSIFSGLIFFNIFIEAGQEAKLKQARRATRESLSKTVPNQQASILEENAPNASVLLKTPKLNSSNLWRWPLTAALGGLLLSPTSASASEQYSSSQGLATPVQPFLSKPLFYNLTSMPLESQGIGPSFKTFINNFVGKFGKERLINPSPLYERVQIYSSIENVSHELNQTLCRALEGFGSLRKDWFDKKVEPFILPNGQKIHFLLQTHTSMPKGLIINVYGGGMAPVFNNAAVEGQYYAVLNLYLSDIVDSNNGWTVEERVFKTDQGSYSLEQINQLIWEIHEVSTQIQKGALRGLINIVRVPLILSGASFGAGLSAKFAASKYKEDFDAYLLRNGPYLPVLEARVFGGIRSWHLGLTSNEIKSFVSDKPVLILTAPKVLEKEDREEFTLDPDLSSYLVKKLQADGYNNIDIEFQSDFGHGITDHKLKEIFNKFVDQVLLERKRSIDYKKNRFELETQIRQASYDKASALYGLEWTKVVNLWHDKDRNFQAQKSYCNLIPNVFQGYLNNYRYLFSEYLHYFKTYFGIKDIADYCFMAPKDIASVAEIFSEKSFKPLLIIKDEIKKFWHQQPNHLNQTLAYFQKEVLFQDRRIDRIAYSYAKQMIATWKKNKPSYDEYSEKFYDLETEFICRYERKHTFLCECQTKIDQVWHDEDLPFLNQCIQDFEDKGSMSELARDKIIQMVEAFEMEYFGPWIEARNAFCQTQDNVYISVNPYELINVDRSCKSIYGYIEFLLNYLQQNLKKNNEDLDKILWSLKGYEVLNKNFVNLEKDIIAQFQAFNVAFDNNISSLNAELNELFFSTPDANLQTTSVNKDKNLDLNKIQWDDFDFHQLNNLKRKALNIKKDLSDQNRTIKIWSNLLQKIVIKLNALNFKLISIEKKISNQEGKISSNWFEKIMNKFRSKVILRQEKIGKNHKLKENYHECKAGMNVLVENLFKVKLGDVSVLESIYGRVNEIYLRVKEFNRSPLISGTV